jgi:hypothetical protein
MAALLVVPEDKRFAGCVDCAGILKDKIQTIFNVEKSWKMFEKGEETSQKTTLC